MYGGDSGTRIMLRQGRRRYGGESLEGDDSSQSVVVRERLIGIEEGTFLSD